MIQKAPLFCELKPATLKKFPPGPKGSWVTGNLYEFKRNPLEFLQALSRDYGDIARFRLGRKRIWQINHPCFIRDILVTHAHDFEKTGLIQQAGRFYSLLFKKI